MQTMAEPAKKEQTHRGGLAQVHRTLQMRRQEPLQAAASGAGADVFVLARAAERRNKETEE